MFSDDTRIKTFYFLFFFNFSGGSCLGISPAIISGDYFFQMSKVKRVLGVCFDLMLINKTTSLYKNIN